VANEASGDITPVDAVPGTAVPAIPIGELTPPVGPTKASNQLFPFSLAVAPGAKTLYVLAFGSDEYGSPGRLVPISTADYTAGAPIAVGRDPQGMAITPNGRTGYVLNGTDAATTPATTPGTVTPVDLSGGKALSPVPVGPVPLSMDMAPNGQFLYVLGSSIKDGAPTGEPSTITPVSTATNRAGAVIKLPVAMGAFPASGLVFTPNSATAYVVTASGVLPVTTSSAAVGHLVGLPTSMPVALAVTPNGATLVEVGTPITAREKGSPYADNVTLALISTATGKVGKVVTLGSEPGAVSWKVLVAPDGLMAYVLVSAQNPSASPLVSDQSTVIPVDLATAKAAKAIDVGTNAQTMALGPGASTLYVLDSGSYNGPGAAHNVPGSVVPVATATGTAGPAITVGMAPYALAVTQPPLDQVQDEVATSAIKAALVAAFAAFSKLKMAQVAGTVPGSVYYSYDLTTRTYWAEAAFTPARGDPPTLMQDAGGFGVFSRPVGGDWRDLGSSLPIACEELAVVPPSVLALWGVAPTDATDCRR
jgi:DNA-binding beta-propeller fold protein YncE